MENIKDMSMEDKKQSIQLMLGLFKQTLIDEGLMIGFDKINNKFLFVDRELYITKNKATGFEILFNELTY